MKSWYFLVYISILGFYKSYKAHGFINILVNRHIATWCASVGTDLMQGCEAVHIGRVDVCAQLQQALHLLLVSGGACRQEHDARRELDPGSTLRRRTLLVCV